MARSSLSELTKCFLKSVGVFFASLIAMKISGLLVIPPGQASIIWPAAGIAAGAMLVCGKTQIVPVFLAAFLKSTWYYDEVGTNELLTAATIAFGATLQAYVAVLLVRKFIKNFRLFDSFSETSLFLFLCGPVACLVNSTVASSALVVLGVITSEQFLAHAATWWLGDILGVVLFAPITVLLMSGKEQYADISVRRKALVGVPLALSFILFVSLFSYAVDVFKDRSYREYEAEMAKLTRIFRQKISVDLTSTVALASFVSSSEYVSAEEFKTFIAPLLQYTKGVYGYSWIPKVEHDSRDQFIDSIRSQGFPDYEILERNSEGELVTARESAVYFPLAYTEPYELNKSAHGLNVYGYDGVAGDVRKQILDQAKLLGESRSTARFSIVQQQGEYGFIVYHPVFKKINDENTHIGFVNGIFIFSQLMDETYIQAQETSSDVILIDKTSGGSVLLFDSRGSDFKEVPEDEYTFAKMTTVVEPISVAGRNWEIVYVRNGASIDGQYLPEIWAFAVGGIVFNILLSLILILVTARNDYIENLVKIKTRELREANEELEEFSYRTSHDLRSPLVSSKGIAEVIKLSINKNESEKAMQGADFLIESLDKLLVLIDDLMLLAKAKNKEEPSEMINIETLIDDCITKFAHMENFDRLQLTREINLKGGIKTKPSRIRLILENLISNSVKYQDVDVDQSCLIIRADRYNGDVIIEIEDNGLGVSEEYRDELFGMFNRFHTKVSYGSGLGLYMVKKSASIIGGTIEYRALDKGSLFILTFPDTVEG